MAKKPESAATLSTAEQVAVLDNLSQAAVAHLLGINGRTLRDYSSLPRREDGSYSGPALVEWVKKRIPEPSLSDDDMERTIVITDTIAAEPDIDAAALVEFLDRVEAASGDGGLAMFARELIERARSLLPHLTPEHEPTPAELQRDIEARVQA